MSTLNSASSSTPAVRLSDVALSYGAGAGATRVLAGLDLDLARGERTALVGPSGSGKTTLLAIVAGLLRPTSGVAETLGERLNDMNEDELARLRRENIGVVFQHFHLLETMTALENAALPLELAGRADAMERAGGILDAVGLGARLRHFPSQLSGGERQRLAIARAFAPLPKLILADEPTGNLDGDTAARALATLFEMLEKTGATMLFVTHNRALLPRFDRALEMRGGKVWRVNGKEV